MTFITRGPGTKVKHIDVNWAGFWFAAMYFTDFSGVALTFGLVFIILEVALVTCGYFALFKENEA